MLQFVCAYHYINNQEINSCDCGYHHCRHQYQYQPANASMPTLPTPPGS